MDESNVEISADKPQLGSIQIGDFVIVNCALPGNPKKLYICTITEVFGNFEFTGLFLRKNSNNTFTFPYQEDISDFTYDQVIKKLDTPQLRRGHYLFSDYFNFNLN